MRPARRTYGQDSTRDRVSVVAYLRLRPLSLATVYAARAVFAQGGAPRFCSLPLCVWPWRSDSGPATLRRAFISLSQVVAACGERWRHGPAPTHACG